MKMKYMGIALLGFCWEAASASVLKSGQVEAELVTEHRAILPGQATWLALRFKPDPGWHTYWKNPGDSGMPTSIKWKTPEGVTVGEAIFPQPELFESMGLKGLGYSKEHFILFPLIVSDKAEAGPISVAGSLSWLSCDAQSCLPGNAELIEKVEIVSDKQDVQKREGAPDFAQLVKNNPKLIHDWPWQAEVREGQLIISIQMPESLKISLKGSKILLTKNGIVPVGADAEWKQEGALWVASLPLEGQGKEIPKDLGVLLHGGELTQAMELTPKKK